MIVLRWAPFPEADVASYNLCRSIIGFSAPKPVPLTGIDGLTLELKFDLGSNQLITFNGVDPVVDQINAVTSGNGGKAFESLNDTANFIVRSDTREAPGKVEIIGGTALALLGLTARVIVEKSEEELLANIPALVDPTEVVSFEDKDGVPEDYYRLSTIDSTDTESLKTEYKQAISFTGAVCVIEGIVTDIQGVRLCDVEVKAKIIKMPQCPEPPAFVSTDEIITRTGTDGRFSLPLLQGALVQISIPQIALCKNICVPVKAFEFLKDISYDQGHQFPLGAK